MLIDEIKKRELGIFECFYIGRNIYKQNLRAILTVALFIGIPVNILLGFIYMKIANLGISINLQEIMKDSRLMEWFFQSAEFKTIILYYFVAFLVQATVYPLITMSVARVTENYANGLETNGTKAMLDAFQKGSVLIVAVLIHETLVSLGMMFFVIPGLFLQIAFFFYVYSIILDNKGSIESMKYSNSLVKGHFAKTALSAVIIYMVNYSAHYIIDMVFSFGQQMLYSTIMSGIFSTVVDCFFIIGITVYYINRKAIQNNTSTEFDGFL